MRYLDCNRCYLHNLDVKNMPLLEKLNVSYTQLNILDVYWCTCLRELNCSGTHISSLSVDRLPDLEYLNIMNTAIMAVSLFGLLKMKEVYGCEPKDRIVKAGPEVKQLGNFKLLFRGLQ